MTQDLQLPRKWTLRAHGRQVIFVKKSNERSAHVIMKALLWALYLPQYPHLQVEIRIGDRYKPDVVQLNQHEEPEFWGEAGVVGAPKIQSLARRFRTTHLAMGKWDSNLQPHIEQVQKALNKTKRQAPFDLINFPADAAERFINEQGNIRIKFDDVEWVRL
ncbi:MAG: hypothetical protein KDE51_09880 [Anaerolineales bacterium]|nr:hypothetical protein [Anaerolineales bacterium]